MANLSRCDVLLLNDNDTPMIFVVIVLERFFGMSKDEAATLMHRIHDEGGACVSHHSPDLFHRIYDAGRGPQWIAATCVNPEPDRRSATAWAVILRFSGISSVSRSISCTRAIWAMRRP